MRTLTQLSILAILCYGIALQASPSQAEPAVSPHATTSGGSDLLELGQMASNDTLGLQNGRQDIRIDQLNAQLSTVSSNGQMDNNVLNTANSTINNGANTIGEGAFAGANGMMTVIQNSGNQVLIENNTVFNLFMK